MQTVPIKRLREKAIYPVYSTDGSAGADLYACLDEPVEIQPHQTVMIPLGYAIALPAGWVGLVFARSGLAYKQDLAPANKVGVIDCDYRGEWMVPIHNHGNTPRTVTHGERIAQMIVVPYLTLQFAETDSLDETARGEGGFGSTGYK